MTPILDLLQQKSSVQVTKSIVKSGRTNWKNVDISIFQFFIDTFEKKYNFTAEHYDNLCDKAFEIDHFVLEIFNESDTDESTDLSFKEFMNLLITELYQTDLLTEQVIANWMTFLTSITNHKDIPETSKMKGNTYLLLNSMLAPFTNVLSFFSDNSEGGVNEELPTALALAIDKLFSILPSAFQYEKHAITFAKEYCDVLLIHHSILLTNGSFLNGFQAMLLYDSRPLLLLAIKGITELCSIEALDDIMKEFLFTVQNENQKSVLQIIIELINFKNLRNEVLGCLKVLTKFQSDNEIVQTNSCTEMFLSLLSKSKKTIAETAELMVALKVDFWLEFVKILNFYANDDEVNIKLILLSIESSVDTDLEIILKFVVDHISEPLVSRRAAEIYCEALQMNNSKEENLGSLIDAISACVEDEITFIVLLQAFIGIDNEIVAEFLKENVNKLTQVLMPMISNAFIDYHKVSSLSIIVNALKKLYIIEPITILPRVRDIAQGLYQILMSLENVEFAEREKIMPKMAVLFEYKCWRLLNDQSMVNLYNFCQKFCTNIKYTHFPQFQRFYVNLIKHFWMILAKNQDLLIEEQKFISNTENILEQIKNGLKSSKNNVQDKCLMLSSLFDLYVLFQPTMSQKLTNQFFKKFSLCLEKSEYLELTDILAKNLFIDSDDGAYQDILIQSFLVFFKAYVNLPSLTSWESLVQHYSFKCTYKKEIERIMLHAIEMKNSCFEKSVAFAILNMSGVMSIEQFRQFLSAFDDFMRQTFVEYIVRNAMYSLICSIVLERLSKNVNQPNNGYDLLVLDFIGLIVKNLDRSCSTNLIKYIKINEGLLSDLEQRKLENFKMMLRN